MRNRRRKIYYLALALLAAGALGWWFGRPEPTADELFGPLPVVAHNAALDRLISVDYVGISAQQAIERIAELAHMPIVVSVAASDLYRDQLTHDVFVVAHDVSARAVLDTIICQFEQMVTIESSDRVTIALINEALEAQLVTRTYDLGPLVRRSWQFYPEFQRGWVERSYRWVRDQMPQANKGHIFDYEDNSDEVTEAHFAEWYSETWFDRGTSTAPWSDDEGRVTFRDLWPTIKDTTVTIRGLPRDHRNFQQFVRMCYRAITTGEDQFSTPPPAQDTLDQPISASWRDTARSEIVRQLADRHGVDLMLFMSDMHERGVRMDERISLDLQDTPLRQAIGEAMIDPDADPHTHVVFATDANGITLAYPQTIEDGHITYGVAWELAIYWTGDLYPTHRYADAIHLRADRMQLADDIHTSIRENDWMDTGGLYAHMEMIGPLLIIDADRSTQQMIHEFLEKKRAGQ